MDGLILFDDVVVFLPYVLIQFLVWWGFFFAERELQISHRSGLERGLGRYLVLKGRQSLGLTLPVIIMYLLRRDVITRFFPGLENDAVAEPIELAVLGFVVLAAAPLFVRLAWPTNSLPPGPLRRRLEHAANRVGFQFTDILVWDTGQTMVNACVTGILPGFRYVLLSDALIESLTPLETAAVFGHEIGHVAHRHFLYFAFFFLGSLGVLSLCGDAVSLVGPLLSQASWLSPRNAVILEPTRSRVALFCSRSGSISGSSSATCLAASSVRPTSMEARLFLANSSDCPPHTDPDNELAPEPVAARKLSLCPVGIRIFADALTNVARSNGLDRRNRSWRHGSIANRIAFLEGLERHPERERRLPARRSPPPPGPRLRSSPPRSSFPLSARSGNLFP